VNACVLPYLRRQHDLTCQLEIEHSNHTACACTMMSHTAFVTQCAHLRTRAFRYSVAPASGASVVAVLAAATAGDVVAALGAGGGAVVGLSAYASTSIEPTLTRARLCVRT
jgi:hypothetical protein